RALKVRFRDQKTEFDTIRWHLGPGGTVCDIGANKGSFTYWLARWCKYGRVIAFEPQPELARRLAGTCRALGLCHVTVEAMAVYSNSGHKDLFMPAPNHPGASLHRKPVDTAEFKILSVPTISLDEYFDRHCKLEERDRISLLKIDAEGAEFDILKGA